MKSRTVRINTKKIQKAIYVFVLISFSLPIAFLIFRIATLDSADVADASYRSRADYVLMLIQCILGIFVMNLPNMLGKRFSFELPPALYISYIIFLYCAIFLGEVRSFYYNVPNWDTILHMCSSMMSAAFGFMVVYILNRSGRVAMSLSPIFVALFAFCFSLAIGAAWEIYEFTFDGLLSLNMQKVMLEDGTLLAGREALADTMKDIIIDAAGALIVSVIGYFMRKRDTSWMEPAMYDKKQDALNQNEKQIAG